jgi:hypothetical protein
MEWKWMWKNYGDGDLKGTSPVQNLKSKKRKL